MVRAGSVVITTEEWKNEIRIHVLMGIPNVELEKVIEEDHLYRIFFQNWNGEYGTCVATLDKKTRILRITESLAIPYILGILPELDFDEIRLRLDKGMKDMEEVKLFKEILEKMEYRVVD